MKQRSLFTSLALSISRMGVFAVFLAQPVLAGTAALNDSNDSVKPDSENRNLLVAHLVESDVGNEQKDFREPRAYQNCRRGKDYQFCGRNSLKIKTLQELKFGRVVGDSQHGGFVVIHADTGAKTVSQLYDAGGFHSRAEFEIRGKPNRKFSVMLPDKIALPVAGQVKPRIGMFTIYPSTTGTLGPDGKARIFVGATLKMGPVQQGGAGSGPVAIYVDYVR